jgi:hypothetical protein
MALKPDRQENYTTIDQFMNETGERGCVVIYDTSVSGLGGLDDAGSVVKKPTDSGGRPAGVLMNDVVNVDLSRYRLNEQKDEVQVNSKVCLLKRGSIKTNVLPAGQNPVAGSGAYFTTNGAFTMFTDALVNPAASGIALRSLVDNAKVGMFTSSKDEDGYVRVEINLP